MVTLAKAGLSKTQLRTALGLSSTTLAKFAKNDTVSLDVIDKICSYLHCPIEDVVECIPDK